MLAMISRTSFNQVYDDVVVSRQFVESHDYYRRSQTRFWRAFDQIQKLSLPADAKAIDIGGGILAVLTSKLLGLECHVGDANRACANDVNALGLPFQEVNLLSDELLPSEPYDLVILTEVIEHLPHPPYIVLERIKRFLKPNGILFLTTPNGTRVRNIIYMLLGKAVLDNFRYPAPGETLGHQHEYTLPELLWQFDHAHMPIISSDEYDDGWVGSSLRARAAHLLVKPFNAVPHLRNGLMISARRQ